MDIIAKRILESLAESGVSDALFEKEIGLPRSTVYDWRNGRSKSYKKYLTKIASFFNVSTSYLLGETDIKKEPAAVSDELKKYINTPEDLEMLELLNQLTPEQHEMIRAQIRGIINNRPNQ